MTAPADELDEILFDHKHKSKNSLKAAIKKYTEDKVVAGRIDELEIILAYEPPLFTRAFIKDRIATLRKGRE